MTDSPHGILGCPGKKNEKKVTFDVPENDDRERGVARPSTSPVLSPLPSVPSLSQFPDEIELLRQGKINRHGESVRPST